MQNILVEYEFALQKLSYKREGAKVGENFDTFLLVGKYAGKWEKLAKNKLRKKT